MNPNQKKEEAPPQAASPHSLTANPDSELTVPVKRVKLMVEGVNQADVDAVLKRLALMRKRLKGDILFLGARLYKMRQDMKNSGDRNWTRFIERNFPFSVKMANTWIRAWENRDSELALSDWPAFMRALYGNEPKALKVPRLTEDEDDDDLEQSGGEGPNFGQEKDFGDNVEKMGLIDDRGKPGFQTFKKLAMRLEAEFFSNNSYTLSAKQELISELIKWLENKKTKLRA